MAPDNSLYHPPRYTAFEFQNSEHLPEAYTKYHENPIKKLSRLSSNDFVAQLIQKQINLILQNEKLFFFFQSSKTAQRNMLASTNIFSKRTPQVHSGISAQNKRHNQKEQGDRNTSAQV